MQEVKISPPMMLEAQAKSQELGRLRNSIVKGEGNLVGFVGEQVAHRVLGGQWNNSYDYDIILEDGTTVDVKTKRTSVKPLPEYDCSVAAYNTKQKCDAYAFVRVLNDYSAGWYLGIISKTDYFDEAEFMLKGTIDSTNGFRIRANCYNVKINKLRDTLGLEESKIH
jgi:hypothetical protein